MTAVDGVRLTERRMVAAGLRAGVELLDQDEQPLAGAAVELILRACGGEFADLGWPWVREADSSEVLDTFWLDVEAMTGWDGGRPEHPVMSFVEALAGGRPARPLTELMRWLDEGTARLVLCAFDHAAAGAGREVALYAFGGDPHQLVQLPAEPAAWPVDELDRYNRPAVQVGPAPRMRPRLKMAGGSAR